MTLDANHDFTAAALAKLARLQASPNFKNFCTADAIEAFAKVPGSAFAGKLLKKQASELDAAKKATSRSA